MRLAIVGSRSLAGNPEADMIIEKALRRHEPVLVVTGDATGIDLMAQLAASRCGIPCAVLRPARRQWEPEGFRARNVQIAQCCQHLIAIIDPTSPTQGARWTASFAQTLDRPVDIFEVQR